MKLTKTSVALSGFYILLVAWWVALQVTHTQHAQVNLLFAFAYGLIPLLFGLTGAFSSKRWGGFHSAVGKAVFFLSLGLITWGVGEMIWSYYNFILKLEVPYPSWSDAFFIVSWPLWSIGVYFLSYATGARFALKTLHGRLLLIIVPVVAILASWYLLVVVARGGQITAGGEAFKVFFDLAYPIGDVVIMSLAFLMYGLSFKLLGGRFKVPVQLFLLGLLVNYFADFGFSYTTTVSTFYNGNWVDLLFTTAMFLMSLGVNLIDVDTL